MCFQDFRTSRIYARIIFYILVIISSYCINQVHEMDQMAATKIADTTTATTTEMAATQQKQNQQIRSIRSKPVASDAYQKKQIRTLKNIRDLLIESDAHQKH